MLKNKNHSHTTAKVGLRVGKFNTSYLCPRCYGTDIKFVATPQLIHEGKFICGHCDHFIKWCPKQVNQVRQLDTQKLIAQLLASGTGLTKWEICFLWSVKGQRKLSPKQREALNKIANGRKL